MIAKPGPVKVIVAIAVVLVCGLAVVIADQSGVADSVGSLSALTNEIRLLRQAVEKSTQTQSQVQALSIYLSAQQNRLNQSVTRADAIRNELAAKTKALQDLSEEAKNYELIIATGPLDERTVAEVRMKGIKEAVPRLIEQQADLRIRLAQADAEVEAGLTRWNEMIARLEQMTRQ